MIAVLVLRQHIRLAEAVLGARFDDPAHVEADHRGKFIQPVEPRIVLALDEIGIVLDPVVLMTAPLQHQLIDGF